MVLTTNLPIETTYSMALMRSMVMFQHALIRAAFSTWEVF